jgi:hypothetical protein
MRLATPSPGRAGSLDDLWSVTATSPRDAWAVGYIFRLSRIRTLILHWNGRHWAHVASPSPGKDAELFGVTATSRSNAWAVGPAKPSRTFMLHWDGRRWKRVATPNQGGAGNGNTLEAVTATSARNAWAVGFYFFRGAAHHTLVLHWNGTRWVHERTPVQGDSSSLFGVGASSTGSAWAVGRFNTGGPSRAAALHCCSQAPPARTAPARTAPLPVLYNLGGSDTASWNLPQRRPKIFFLAADGSAALGNKPHHLKWSRWTRKSATATGRYFFRNGPCCTYHSRSVRITANHVVRQNAHQSWYDRMTIRFSKTRSVVLQYKRAAGHGFWDTVSGQFP